MLTTDATKLAVHSLVTSRLDYCNSLLSGINKSLLTRLQNVQRTVRESLSDARNMIPLLLNWFLSTGCPLISALNSKFCCWCTKLFIDRLKATFLRCSTFSQFVVSLDHIHQVHHNWSHTELIAPLLLIELSYVMDLSSGTCYHLISKMPPQLTFSRNVLNSTCSKKPSISRIFYDLGFSA